LEAAVAAAAAAIVVGMVHDVAYAQCHKMANALLQFAIIF